MTAASVAAMLRLLLAWALLGLVVAPAASAAGTIEILRDCADDGRLQGNYSPAELRNARKNIPTDTDEYTDCRDVLARAAVDAVAGGGGGGGGGGGAAAGGGGGTAATPGASGPSGGSATGGDLVAPSTPEDREAIAQASRAGAPKPVEIDGRPVIPGASGLAANAARNDIPVTLLIALVLLGLAALAAALPPARRRLPLVSRRVLGRLGR
jgi:hypothetical protein